MTLGGERRRLALTKVRPAGEHRRAASLCWLGAPATSGLRALPGAAASTQRGGGHAGEPGPPARLSAQRRGSGAGGWGPGGGGAASLWAAPGRGLSAALRPPAPNADSESGGDAPHPPAWPHPKPLGVRGEDGAPAPTGARGPLPAGPQPRSVGYAQLTAPARGLSSGAARRQCAPAMECPGRRRA